jgi:K+-transporting ATPase ATPase C chain
MRNQLRPAIVSTLLLAAICGLAYPLAVTATAQIIFPSQANGSLIVQDGHVAGSALIGQSFDAPQYFWGRLSATSLYPYNAAASAGSNLGSTNPALVAKIQDRIAALHAADPENTAPIPVDLVTSSGSGLDPDISVAAAHYQISRVARARGLAESAVVDLVDAYTTGRQLGILGEARVNVLTLNLALDGVRKQ